MSGPDKEIHTWLTNQAGLVTLRLITCGDLQAGKSTLTSRLLEETREIHHDRHPAMLVDGLADERRRGSTIDVGYHFFSTPRRRFIVGDTPGDAAHTRNMISGASTADVAVILIDATKGLQEQTCRHAYLASLMGIRHAVLAINKMDMVNFDVAVFHRIEQAFRQWAEPLGFITLTAIPLSAVSGDNISVRSTQTHWYKGPTLLGYLETIDDLHRETEQLLFPVQHQCRTEDGFVGYAGSLIGGSVRIGDAVRVAASGHLAHIDAILTHDGLLEEARSGYAITLVLDQAIDAGYGDIITAADQPLDMSDQFEATLIWLHEEPGLVGRNYEIKLTNQWAGASITSIKHCINVQSGTLRPCKKLGLNDISVCNLSTSRMLAFAPHTESRSLGSFILVDRFSKETIATGLINHNLRRAQNVHRQALSIGRADRERLNGHRGKVIWFTGLSGSGKSTLANAVEKELHAQGKRTYILDGDNVRQGLNKDLGFTDADRVENIRRVAEVAKLMMDAGLIVMTAFISPFRAERQMARELIGEDHFIEVYVDTPLEICEERDPKGLYKKARRGELPNMTGINSPYEPPLNPTLVARTHELDMADLVEEILVELNEI